MDLYPETASDALARWDRGESVFTVEMGGIGPGYEQGIQLIAFEIIRVLDGTEIPWSETERVNALFEEVGQWVAQRHDDALGGVSGGQLAAAKQLAARGLKVGWDAMLREQDEGRRILARKHSPRLNESAAPSPDPTPPPRPVLPPPVKRAAVLCAPPPLFRLSYRLQKIIEKIGERGCIGRARLLFIGSQRVRW